MSKKSTFISIFVCTHIVGLFLYINNYSKIIKSSYQKQHKESLLNTLKHKKQMLTHQVCKLHNYDEIKKFAKNVLHMEPLAFNQLKKLPNNEYK